MSKTFSIFKKILVSAFLLFCFNAAQAAASDCSQLVADGQMDCIPATVKYTGIYGGPFTTLQDIISDYTSRFCKRTPAMTNCETKYVPAYPTPCYKTSSIVPCDAYTEIYKEYGDYDANVIVQGFVPQYNKWTVIGNGLFDILESCPTDYTKVKIENGKPADYLCKPKYSTRAVFCETKGKKATSSNSNGSCISKQKGQSEVGLPVNLNNGSMTHEDTDYSYKGNSDLSIQRHYNSLTNRWTFNYSRNINYLSTSLGQFITLTRDNGQAIVFNKIDNVWINSNPNNLGTLLDHTNSGNVSDLSLYEFLNSNGDLESYDINGRLVKIKSLDGKILDLTYETIKINSDVTYFYTYITDESLNKLVYRTENSPGSCGSPSISNIKFYQNDIQKLSYNYSYVSNACRITTVTYPDTTTKKYTYSSTRLITETDQNNDIYSKWAYSGSASASKGYFLTTSHGLGATGAINKNTFTYITPTQLTKTDARSNVTTINSIDNANGTYNTSGFPTGVCSDCDGFQGNNTTYDSNGNVNSYTDFNNNLYQNTYDSQSRLITKKEAVGTALERQTSYTWHLDTRLLATKTQPVSGGQMVTEYIYDDTYDANNILSKSLLKEIKVTAPHNDGTTDSTTKTWKYYYDLQNNLTKIENPRYVESSGTINDKVEMTYLNGNAASVTNGKNQTMTFTNYNEYGLPTNIVDPAGRTNILTYDVMGRVLTSTYETDEVTSFQYDGVGQITKVISPTHTYQKLYYDTAHRLIKIEDYNESDTYLGKTEFTLDNMSNMTAVAVYNPSNVQLRLSTAQYDNKNRLYKTLGALNQTSTYLYDNNNNPTEVKDPLNNSVTSTYDALNRLSTITNPDSGVISTTYRLDNNVATVTDPKNLTTTYTYNGFGDLIKLQSLDSGTTEITYDIGSNPINYKDARNQVSTYSYDQLNRLTNVNYTGATSENVTLTYDTCTNGIGLTCSVTDSSGTRNYSYNVKGRLASKEYINGTFSKTVGYNYNTSGQLDSMTYPSGKVVQYTYENDNINSISYTDGATTTNILNSATYEAFNDIPTNFIWGNNATYAQNFNKDGLISSINATNAYPVNKSYMFDTRYNITNIIDPLDGLRDSTSTYDNKSRINHYSFGIIDNLYDYSYNTSDDRLTSTDNTLPTSNYLYDTTSHRLNEITGSSPDVMTYDNNGNILTSAGKTYTYNAANRMASSSDGTNTTNYLINFSGERTKKTNGTNTTWFIYDDMGNIIAEYNHNGDLANEYVYMDGNLVGLIKDNNLHYVYTDHLGTPRAVTDTSNNLKWTWENKEAFGKNLPDENISSTPFNFNFRFPGQYYDSETGLNYNINRDYNPNWGRYVQSDPIGLMGGINTYGYVGGNSLSSYDPLGLSGKDIDNIRNTFNSSVQNMINKNMRLPGDNSKLFNFNNYIAKACNPNIQNRGAMPFIFNLLNPNGCQEFQQTIEYCDGQSTYLLSQLNKNVLRYDDNWKFVSQNNGNHWWVVGLSSNNHDPIVYLDAWATEMSLEKPCTHCKNGSKIGDRPLTKKETQSLLLKGKK